MSTAPRHKLVTVEEYLEGELISPIKHDYRDGVVYAMAGAGIVHNVIAMNTSTAVQSRLRGRRCRAYNSDMKIRVHLASSILYYYPDLSVVCSSNPTTDSFQDEPVVIFEVLSRKTRHTDLGVKKNEYLTIPSLAVYVLFEQETATALVFRKTPSGFVREMHEGMQAILPLGEIGIDLPLAEIYEDVVFSAEPAEDEES